MPDVFGGAIPAGFATDLAREGIVSALFAQGQAKAARKYEKLAEQGATIRMGKRTLLTPAVPNIN
jgi:hypothetical protein